VKISLIVIFLSILQASFSQKLKLNTSQKEIVVTYADSTIKANISTVLKKINPKNNIEYTWYSSNSIKTNYGGFSGKLLDGPYQVFDLKNRLITQGRYLNGLRHGTWKFWLSDGTLSSLVPYIKGQKNGQAEYNNPEKNTTQIINFKKDLLNGWSVLTDNKKNYVEQTHYKSGKKHGLYLYKSNNGSLVKKYNYKNDLLNGKSTEVLKDSNLVRICNYKKGKKEGTLFESDTLNVLAKKYKYKNNLKHGICVDYQKNKVIEAEYIRGKKEGNYIEKVDKKIVLKGHYLNDEKDGEWVQYTSNDTIVDIYVKGSLVR